MKGSYFLLDILILIICMSNLHYQVKTSDNTLNSNIDNNLNNSCSSYYDCFNCTINNATKLDCIWKDGVCIYSQNKESSDRIWWNDFSSCKDFVEAETTMLNYCGKNETTVPNLISLPGNKSFGAVNLFCSWSIQLDRNKLNKQTGVEFNFTSIVNN